MSDEEIIDGFHGVYMLYCKNPKFLGRTYIGYTVNPNRRISQHNKGKGFGGASRTSAKGPWEMAIIIHGFPSDVAALKFEWAWQNPHRSRSLAGAGISQRKTSFDDRLKTLWIMLRSKPWSRLPLSIRWLSSQLQRNTKAGLAPPPHMPIIHGSIKTKKKTSKKPENQSTMECFICKKTGSSQELISCLNIECLSFSHLRCLANSFLEYESDQLIPVAGYCPSCSTEQQWGDIVRKSKGLTVETEFSSSVT